MDTELTSANVFWLRVYFLKGLKYLAELNYKNIYKMYAKAGINGMG